MSARRIEAWRGVELRYEGRQIVYARFKLGGKEDRLWFTVPDEHYGSKQECLAYKEALAAERTRQKRKRVTHEDNLKKLEASLDD